MILLVPITLAVIFTAASVLVWRSPSARAARVRSVAVVVIGALLAAAALLTPALLPTVGFDLAPSGMLMIAPLVTALVALIALGIAPLTTHGPATFARVLLLFGFAEAFLATDHPLVLALLWAASSGVAWVDLRARRPRQGWQRVFGVYQLLSLVCFAAGALLIWRGASASTAAVVLLVGVAVRAGMVPVHSWFPRFVEHAPMAIVVAFVAPQLGVYAQLQLLDLSALGDIAGVVAAFGAVTAVLGAMLGVVQVRARRALGYLILSQTGLVMFGLESHTSVGLTGALLSWQVLAIATSGFAMALAALEARRGPMTLLIPQGDFGQTPKLGIAFLVLGFASVGFPLTLGFVAEDLLVQGTVEQFPVLGLSLVVATAFNGITVLRAFFYLFTGARRTQGEPDLSRREGYVFGFAMAALLVFGLVPRPLVSYESPSIARAVEIPGGDERAAAPAGAHSEVLPSEAPPVDTRAAGARASAARLRAGARQK